MPPITGLKMIEEVPFEKKIKPSKRPAWKLGTRVERILEAPTLGEPTPSRALLPNVIRATRAQWGDVKVDMAYSNAGITGDLSWAQHLEEEHQRWVAMNPYHASSWLEESFIRATQLVPAIAQAGIEGVKVGLGTAATLSMLTAGPDPTDIVTAPLGFALGFRIGAFGFWSRQGHGMMIRESLRRGIPFETARLIAIPFGPLYGAIEYSQVALAAGVPKAALKTQFKGVMYRLGAYGLSHFAAIAQEIGEEGAQKALEEGFLLSTQKYLGLIQDSRSQIVAKVFQESMTEMKDSAVPLMFLMLPRAVRGAAGAPRAISQGVNRLKTRATLTKRGVPWANTGKVIDRWASRMEVVADSVQRGEISEEGMSKEMHDIWFEEVNREAKASMESLSRLFPKAEFTYIGEGQYLAELPNGERFVIRSAVIEEGPEAARAEYGERYEEAGVARAQFVRRPQIVRSDTGEEFEVAGAIEYAQDMHDKDDIPHEMGHVFYQLFATDAERALIDKMTATTAEGIPVAGEAAFAQKLRQVAVQRNKPFARIVERIRDTAAWLDVAMKGDAASNWSKQRTIMRQVGRGQITGLRPVAPAKDVSYALRKDVQDFAKRVDKYIYGKTVVDVDKLLVRLGKWWDKGAFMRKWSMYQPFREGAKETERDVLIGIIKETSQKIYEEVRERFMGPRPFTAVEVEELLLANLKREILRIAKEKDAAEEDVSYALREDKFRMSPELQRLHDSRVRSQGLEVSRDSEVRDYFRQIRTLARKYGRMDIVELADEGERKYFDGTYEMAVMASEGALGYLHQVETLDAHADLKEFERVSELPDELIEEERRRHPFAEDMLYSLRKRAGESDADAWRRMAVDAYNAMKRAAKTGDKINEIGVSYTDITGDPSRIITQAGERIKIDPAKARVFFEAGRHMETRTFPDASTAKGFKPDAFASADEFVEYLKALGQIAAGRTPVIKARVPVRAPERPVEPRTQEIGIKVPPKPVSELKQPLKVISGGQTGADIGALIGAKSAGFATGGMAPAGWKTELGAEPDLKSFGLVQHISRSYSPRTMANVDAADGTVAFLWGPSAGTEKTVGYAVTGEWRYLTKEEGGPVGQQARMAFKNTYLGIKPVLVIRKAASVKDAIRYIKEFVSQYNIKTLNVTGHKESKQPGIGDFVAKVIVGLVEPAEPREPAQLPKGEKMQVTGTQAKVSPGPESKPKIEGIKVKVEKPAKLKIKEPKPVKVAKPLKDVKTAVKEAKLEAAAPAAKAKLELKEKKPVEEVKAPEPGTPAAEIKGLQKLAKPAETPKIKLKPKTRRELNREVAEFERKKRAEALAQPPKRRIRPHEVAPTGKEFMNILADQPVKPGVGRLLVELTPKEEAEILGLKPTKARTAYEMGRFVEGGLGITPAEMAKRRPAAPKVRETLAEEQEARKVKETKAKQAEISKIIEKGQQLREERAPFMEPLEKHPGLWKFVAELILPTSEYEATYGDIATKDVYEFEKVFPDLFEPELKKSKETGKMEATGRLLPVLLTSSELGYKKYVWGRFLEMKVDDIEKPTQAQKDMRVYGIALQEDNVRYARRYADRIYPGWKPRKNPDGTLKKAIGEEKLRKAIRDVLPGATVKEQDEILRIAYQAMDNFSRNVPRSGDIMALLEIIMAEKTEKRVTARGRELQPIAAGTYGEKGAYGTEAHRRGLETVRQKTWRQQGVRLLDYLMLRHWLYNFEPATLQVNRDEVNRLVREVAIRIAADPAARADLTSIQYEDIAGLEARAAKKEIRAEIGEKGVKEQMGSFNKTLSGYEPTEISYALSNRFIQAEMFKGLQQLIGMEKPDVETMQKMALAEFHVQEGFNAKRTLEPLLGVSTKHLQMEAVRRWTGKKAKILPVVDIDVPAILEAKDPSELRKTIDKLTTSLRAVAVHWDPNRYYYSTAKKEFRRDMYALYLLSSSYLSPQKYNAAAAKIESYYSVLDKLLKDTKFEDLARDEKAMFRKGMEWLNYKDMTAVREWHRRYKEFLDADARRAEIADAKTAKDKALLDFVETEIPAVNSIYQKTLLETGHLKKEDILPVYVGILWDMGEKTTTWRKFKRFPMFNRHSIPRTLEGGIAEGLSIGLKLEDTDVTSAWHTSMLEAMTAVVHKMWMDESQKVGVVGPEKLENMLELEHYNAGTWKRAGDIAGSKVILNVPGATEGVISSENPVRRKKLTAGKVAYYLNVDYEFTDPVTGVKSMKNADVALGLVQPKALDTTYRIGWEDKQGKRTFFFEQRAPLYAYAPFATFFNRATKNSKLMAVPTLAWITKFNAIFKQLKLLFGFFHIWAFNRSMLLGGSLGVKGLNIPGVMRLGWNSISRFDPYLMDLIWNGMTLFRIQDYDPVMAREQTWFGKWLDDSDENSLKAEFSEKVWKKAMDMKEHYQKWLFGTYGATLKAATAVHELKRALKRNKAKIAAGEMTVEDVSASVADLMNNDFGGLDYAALGYKPETTHVLRLAFLGPDWTMSNARTVVQAIRNDEMGKAHRAFWTRIAYKGFLTYLVFNFLFGAGDDEDWLERFRKAWKAGNMRWLDIDISPLYHALGGDPDIRKYIKIFGHFTDPVKFAAHPARTLKYKSSVMGRLFFNAVSGEDYKHARYTSFSEFLGLKGRLRGTTVSWYTKNPKGMIRPRQFPSFVMHSVKSFAPIPIEQSLAFMSGEIQAWDWLFALSGIGAQTTYKSTRRRRTLKGGSRGRKKQTTLRGSGRRQYKTSFSFEPRQKRNFRFAKGAPRAQNVYLKRTPEKRERKLLTTAR